MALTGMRILVVEDARDVLDVFTMLLRTEGAEVAGAASGREALMLFGSRPFDVIVTDLALPDIPGDVLIRAMIATARAPIDIVVITGESPAVSARALDAGARVVFAKPCQWGRVVAYLNGLGVAAAA